MSTIQKRLLIVLGIGAAAFVLALVLGGGMREAIAEPILYTLWVLGDLIDAIPQQVLWAVFLAIAGIMAVGSLHARLSRMRHPKVYAVGEQAAGRVRTLWRRVQETTYGDNYFRRRLARRLLELTLQAKGYHEQMGLPEVEALLASGRLRLPAGGRAYLESGLTLTRDEGREGRLKRLWLRVQEFLFQNRDSAACDSNLTELVDYLEKELEIRP